MQIHLNSVAKITFSLWFITKADSSITTAKSSYRINVINFRWNSKSLTNSSSVKYIKSLSTKKIKTFICLSSMKSQIKTLLTTVCIKLSTLAQLNTLPLICLANSSISLTPGLTNTGEVRSNLYSADVTDAKSIACAGTFSINYCANVNAKVLNQLKTSSISYREKLSITLKPTQ